MKKLLQCLLAVFLGLGLLQFSTIPATALAGPQEGSNIPSEDAISVTLPEDGVLKSCYVDGFFNEVKLPQTLVFLYEVKENINYVNINFSYYSTESNRVINMNTMAVNQGKTEIDLSENLKYMGENFIFLYFKIGYVDEFMSWKEAYYSNLTYEQIISYEEYSSISEENLYHIVEDFSFKVEDPKIDLEKPTIDIESLKINKDGDSISVEFNSDEYKDSGISEMNLTFVNKETNGTLSLNNHLGKLENVDKEYSLTQSIDYSSFLYSYGIDYGTYELTMIMISDNAQNSVYYEEDSTSEYCISFPSGLFKFEITPNDNPYESLTKDDIKIKTNYDDNNLHYRKGEQLPEYDDIEIYYIDKKDKESVVPIVLPEGYWNTYTYIKSQITDTNQSELTVSLPFKAYYNDNVRFNIEVKVVFEEKIGTIIAIEYPKEVALKYEKFKNWDFENEVYFTVQLDTGEKVQEKANLYSGAMGSGVMEDEYGRFSFFEYRAAIVPPKYDLDERFESSFMGVMCKTIYYLVNDKGDLVNDFGNVIMTKEQRNKHIVNYKTESNSVGLSSPFGSAPTETVLKVEEKEIDEKNDYVAYDMSLDSYGFSVQPADDVTLSIDLPNNLIDKEVEVYYVDDAGAKHLVEGSKVENGTVTFDTDHFSTYAVIAKDNKPEEPEKPTEPEKPVEPEKPSQGNTEVDVPTVNPKEEVKEVTVGVENAKKTEDILNESIKDDKVLGPLAEKAIQEGKDVNISAKPTLIDPTKVSAEVKKEIEKIIAETSKNDLTVAQYLDITIHVMADNEPLGNLTSTKEKLKFQIAIPEDLKKEGRTFIVFRIHDGKVEKLETVEKDGLLVFESDQFSTYALAYKDTETTKPSAPNTSDHLMILNFVVMTILSGLIFVVLKKRTSFEK